MAWTSSAGPKGGFALAGGASERDALPPNATIPHRAKTGARHPLVLATLAQASGLALVFPFVDSDVLIALPAAIGLAVSYLTLSRRTLNAGPRAVSDAIPPRPDREEQHTVDELPGDTQDMPCAAAHVADLPCVTVVLPSSNAPSTPPTGLQPIQIDAELRSELMARVSHELRTPLNAVMGFSDLMGHQMFGPLGHPRYEEYVTHIRESSQRLLKSAEDTLAMTSLMAKSASRSEREILPLASLFAEAKTSVASELTRRDIASSVDIDADIEVIAHRRALRQALVNVLHEALAQASDGARITVTATCDLERVAVLVTLDDIAMHSEEAHHSLPICLARTLLELDGCQLYENNATDAAWSVLVSLDGAIQQDFFAHASAI